MGSSNFLHVDQGSNFVLTEFQARSKVLDIQILEAPIECPNSLSYVELYHSPLRMAFLKIEANLQAEHRPDILQMAPSTLNITLGPEGSIQTLCVSGSTPRLAKIASSPNQAHRAKVVHLAMNEIQKDLARRKIAFAAKYHGPYGSERIYLDNLSLGSPVLIYHTRTKKWEGPFYFVSKDGGTV